MAEIDMCTNGIETVLKKELSIKIEKDKTFNISFNGKKYKIIESNNDVSIFEQLDEVEKKSFFDDLLKVQLKDYESEKEILAEKYKLEHCNEFHAQAERPPCPMPSKDVIELFKSLNLTPPSLSDSNCFIPFESE